MAFSPPPCNDAARSAAAWVCLLRPVVLSSGTCVDSVRSPALAGTALPMTSAINESALLQQALALHQQGRLSEAGGIYRQILQANPAQPNALHLLGLITAQQGQVEEAVACLRKALSIDPQSALCNSDLGLLLYGLERFDESVNAFRRAIELQPTFPQALCRWGDLYREFCYSEQAISCYRRALAQEPQLSEAADGIRSIQKAQQDLSALARMIKNGQPSRCQGTIEGQDQPGIQRREFLPHLLNQLGLVGVGAEIGVKEGKFSERILRHWQGNVLYSIDPWREFPSAEYVDVSNVSQSQQDGLYKKTIRRLMPFERRSIIWRMTSREAAELLPESGLDFCYIDADHSYQGVRDDIRMWYPKVRPGGILAGHDYISDGTYEFGVFGVQKAVNEFVESASLDLLVTNEPVGGFPSWIVFRK